MNPQITIDHETGLFSDRLDDGTTQGTVVRSTDKTTLEALLNRVADDNRRDRLANWFATGLAVFVVLVSIVAAWLFA